MVDINIGAISEALNNKTDRNMRNVDTGVKADSVIDYQEPTAGNGYTWYRKYASGWVEQGGKVGPLNNSNITVILPVAMANSTYTALVTGQNADTASNYAVVVKKPTTTTIVVSSLANYGSGANWQVSGMAA
jgi:hypothetical protein